MAFLLLALALQASAPLYVRGLLTPFPHSGIGSDFASWQTVPTIGDMHSAYPSGLKGRLESWLNCDLADDGRLKRCTVSAQYPDDPKVKPAMLKLVRKLRAKPDYVAVAHEQNAKVWVDLIMAPAEDDNADFSGSLCPSPFCIPVPPPPPPPPAHN